MFSPYYDTIKIHNAELLIDRSNKLLELAYGENVILSAFVRDSWDVRNVDQDTVECSAFGDKQVAIDYMIDYARSTFG